MAKVTRVPGDARKRLEKALASIEGRAGRVGWFDSAKYPDGTPVAYIASIHTFGYPPKNIPMRLDLRGLSDERQSEWARIARFAAKKVIAGEVTADEMLELLGAAAEGDIRKLIASVQLPELAASTKAARARRMGIAVEALTGTGAKPLVEPTMSKKNGGGPGGLLLATVTHNVGAAGDDDKKAIV